MASGQTLGLFVIWRVCLSDDLGVVPLGCVEARADGPVLEVTRSNNLVEDWSREANSLLADVKQLVVVHFDLLEEAVVRLLHEVSLA